MTTISTKVNNLNVTFSEGEFRNVKVYVDGELQEERQSTWFLSALLEEAIRLKEENRKLEERINHKGVNN